MAEIGSEGAPSSPVDNRRAGEVGPSAARGGDRAPHSGSLPRRDIRPWPLASAAIATNGEDATGEVTNRPSLPARPSRVPERTGDAMYDAPLASPVRTTGKRPGLGPSPAAPRGEGPSAVVRTCAVPADRPDDPTAAPGGGDEPTPDNEIRECTLLEMEGSEAEEEPAVAGPTLVAAAALAVSVRSGSTPVALPPGLTSGSSARSSVSVACASAACGDAAAP